MIELNPLNPVNAALGSFFMFLLMIVVVLVLVNSFENNDRIPTALKEYVSEQILDLILMATFGTMGLVFSSIITDKDPQMRLAFFSLIGAFVIWQNWPLYEIVYRILRKAEQ